MGVKGLWQLLESIGRPVNCENLQYQTVAIDISLWIHQAVRANNASKTAHLETLLRRIAKLWFYQIKPIFVFDGPNVPIFKRQTLSERRLRREIAANRLENARQKMLIKHLQKEVLRETPPSKNSSKKSLKLPKLPVYSDEDAMYDLPSTSSSSQISSIEDDSSDFDENEYLSDLEEEEESFISTESQRKLLSNGINLETFNELPLHIQQSIFMELDEEKEEEETELTPSSSAQCANDFSSSQMQKLLQKANLKKQIAEAKRSKWFRNQQKLLAIGGVDMLDCLENVAVAGIVKQSKEKFVLFVGENKAEPFASSSSTSNNTTDDEQLPKKIKTNHESVVTLSDDEILNPEKIFPSVEKFPKFDQSMTLPHDVSTFEQDNIAITAKNPCIDVESPVKKPKNVATHKMNGGDEIIRANAHFESGDDDSSSDDFIEVDDVAIISDEEKRCDIQIEDFSSSTKSETSSQPENSQNGAAAQFEDAGSPDETAAQFEDAGSPDETAAQFEDAGSKNEAAAKPGDAGSKNDPGAKTFVNSVEKFSFISDECDFWQPPRMSKISRVEAILDDEIDCLMREQRVNSNVAVSLSEQLYAECQELLKICGLPYIVAHGEAEAQCAWLETNGFVRAVVTEDSDVWLFGASRTYKNLFSRSHAPLMFKSKDAESELGLDRRKIVLIAILCGCDYSHGVEGIGPVTALEIVAEFGRPSDENVESLQRFREWYENARKNSIDAVPPVSEVRARLQKKNLVFPDSFPNRAIFDCFFNPEIDENDEKFQFGDPDLDSLRSLAVGRFGWTNRRFEDLVLPAAKKWRTNKNQTKSNENQTKLTNFLSKIQEKTEKIEFKQSKRLQAAISKLKNLQKNSGEKNAKVEKKRKISTKRKKSNSKSKKKNSEKRPK